MPLIKLTKLINIIIFFSFFSFALINDDTFNETFFNRVEALYGPEKKENFYLWRNLLNEKIQYSEIEKLNYVNQFANKKIRYRTDLTHWEIDDYWATPIESLGSGYGDCEDFAIFKYVSLIALGIDESKLRLMYVRALTIDEPHMVLIYSEGPQSIPLVLDNLKAKILPANQRLDLKPIYSFNGQGLWLAKAKGLGNKVKSGAGSKDWTTLMQRIEKGQ